MATTFTWSINSMDVIPSIDSYQDFVSSLEWKLTGSDGTNTEFIEVGFAYKPEDITSYVPHDQLTEEQVIGWVHSRLGETGIEHFESVVQKKLDDSKLPNITTESKPLPWASKE